MNKKYEEKRQIFNRVKQARFKISQEFNRRLITNEDIVWLLQQDNDFGLKKNNNIKKQVLQEIFNCPFLLCDQMFLSDEIRKLLPQIIRNRYEYELDELYYLEEIGYISPDELLNKKEILKFCYYETSIEGSEIFNSGNVKKKIK